MPLTKDEIIERCDKLFDTGKRDNSMSIIQLGILVYISNSSIFGDITFEESKELTKYYLNKTEDWIAKTR